MKVENLAIFWRFSCRKPFRFAIFNKIESYKPTYRRERERERERESQAQIWDFQFWSLTLKIFKVKKCNLKWHVWFGWGQNSITNPTPTLSLSLLLSTFPPPGFKMCAFVPSISTWNLYYPNSHSLVLIFFFSFLFLTFSLISIRGFSGLVNRLWLERERKR